MELSHHITKEILEKDDSVETNGYNEGVITITITYDDVKR